MNTRMLVTAVYLLAIGHLGQFHDHLLAFGRWAPAVSIMLMVAQSVAVPVPVTLLMVANGLVFGVWQGMFVSFAGAFIGAIFAFYLGRRFGRRVIEYVVSKPALDSADALMARRGGWAIVLGRWVPGIPCDPFSYAAGVMRMPWAKFLTLTVVGLIPANLITSYLGAKANGDVRTGYWLLGIATIMLLWIGLKYVITPRRVAMN